MLIRNARLWNGAHVDLRIGDGCVQALASCLSRLPGESVFDAQRGVVLPGLRDHHLHLQALAAAQASLHCGPLQCPDAESLARRLRAAACEGSGWLRGVGYHESVAGEIDAAWLDRVVPERPLRIQHRSGRLWMLNSAALRALGVRDHGDDPCERRDGRLSGRLYDADGWLRERLAGQRPDLRAISRRLARRGVVAVTDTSADNDPETLAHFAAAQQRDELLQALQMMGDARLDGPYAAQDVPRDAALRIGAHKFHLHEHELPEFDTLCAAIARSHRHRRPVAFHCVTRADLVYALSALQQAGTIDGDRIEHASITPPELLDTIASLRLAVVTQPQFVSERGDRYLDEVAPEDLPWLYRLRAFVERGVALAGSTDAPYGEADPWQAIDAAVCRLTPDGRLLGAGEALTPEQALSLFTAPLTRPGAGPLQPLPGQPADLCVLAQPWAAVRLAPRSAEPRLCLRAGRVLYVEARAAERGGLVQVG